MQQILRKIHFILLVCFVLSMPFSLEHVKVNSFFIILLITNAVFLAVSQRVPLERNKVLMAFLFSIVYLVAVFALVNSNNIPQAMFELQKKLSLLLFPVIMLLTPSLTIKETRIIALSFVAACLLVAVYCLFAAAYYCIALGDSTFFFRHNLSMLVGMHATYLSLYYCFSIVLIGFLYHRQLQELREKFLCYLVIGILLLSILLLGGRMQILVLLIGAVVYFIFQFRKSNNKLKSVITALGILAMVVGLTFAFPNNREKFKEAFNYNIGNRWGEQQIRGSIWKCSFQLIHSAPVLGVGTGDVQDELQKCYIDNQYTSLTYWENVKFNAHNQYLEIAIESGFIGLSLFLTSIIVSLVFAFRNGKKLYFVFIIVFAISCLSESLLERQSGIVFWSFFNILLCFNNINEDENIKI